MTIIHILIAFLPPFISNGIRKLLGAKFGKGAKIGFGSIVMFKSILLEEGARIKSFSFVKCDIITMKKNSVIKPFTIVKVKKLLMGQYSSIRPFAIINSGLSLKSELQLGDHSSIFPFCWIEPTEGVFIGNQVGVGGHTFIFTHGSWSNYLKGGPVQFGPVHIEDNVWLPWRNFIMPNVRIGKDSIISANSVVNKDIPANSLVGGTPAKVIKSDFMQRPDDNEIIIRTEKIVDSFFEKTGIQKNSYPRIIIEDVSAAAPGDLLLIVNKTITEKECIQIANQKISIYSSDLNKFFISDKKDEIIRFKNFISFYGIRPYVEYL